ncbi:MAG: protein kinase [Gemmataceae bacterium]
MSEKRSPPDPTRAVCPGCGLPRPNEGPGPFVCPSCGTMLPSLGSTGPFPLPPPPGVPALPPPHGTSAMHAALPALPRLPGYEILELLASRPDRDVYRARQTGLRRLVTVELLAPWAVPPDLAMRFRHEASRLARLNHPHLLALHDVGEYENRLYFTREYFPRGNLAALLVRQPLPPAEAALLVEKLARALQVAHERGLVHGQIGPGDVYLDDHGEPHLAGFGLHLFRRGLEPTPAGDIRDLAVLLRTAAGGTLPPEWEAVAQAGEQNHFRSPRGLAGALREVLDQPCSSYRTLRATLTAARWSLLLLSALLLVVLAGAAALNLRGLRAALPITLARADLWVWPAGTSLSSPSSLPVDDLKRMAAHPGVEFAQAFVGGPTVLRRPGEPGFFCLVLGDDLGDGPTLGPTSALPASLRDRLQPLGTIIIHEADRLRLGLTGKPDERILLGRQVVRVVGLADFPASVTEPRIYCSARTARAILELPVDRLTSVLLRCQDDDEATRLADTLRSAIPGITVLDRDTQAWFLRREALLAGPLGLAWGICGLVSLVVAGTCLRRAPFVVPTTAALLGYLIFRVVEARLAPPEGLLPFPGAELLTLAGWAILIVSAWLSNRGLARLPA